MSRLKKLIGEVHRRSLWQVLGIYLAGSWIALQVVETLTESMGLPGWVQPFAFVLLVIGFPIVVATAFVQEGIASRGIRPIESGDPSGPDGGSVVASGVEVAGMTAGSGGGMVRWLTWRNAMIGGVSAFALWGVIATVLMFVGVRPGAVASGSEGDRVSIAVLPFSSVGTDEDSRVFSLGIHDDLLTRLSKIGSLRVISRTSVMEYQGAEKNIRQIGDELGVSHILEGSVLSAGGEVNINAQLIDADTDEHLWAETYNRSLSVGGIFAIQRELAQRITSSLSAALLPEEVADIEAPPTEDLEAYNLFLRGHTCFHEGPRSPEFMLAIEMYEKAVELDPEFALDRSEIDLLARDFDSYAERNPDGLSRFMGLVLRGDGAAEGAQVDSLRASFEERVAEDPGAWFPHALLGYLYAVLDRSEDAVREADEAVDLMPVSTDHLAGPDPIWWKVLTLGRLEAVDEALEALRELLRVSFPGEYTPAYIRLHPGVDPIRDDPRFEEILRSKPRRDSG